MTNHSTTEVRFEQVRDAYNLLEERIATLRKVYEAIVEDPDPIISLVAMARELNREYRTLWHLGMELECIMLFAGNKLNSKGGEQSVNR